MTDNQLALRRLRPTPVRQVLEGLYRKDSTIVLHQGWSYERFARTIAAVVLNNPDLGECSAESFIQAIRKAAELGLTPGIGELAEGWLVPKAKQASFWVGHRGLKELALRKGWMVDDAVVWTGDEFDVLMGTERRIVHRPRLSRSEGARVEYAYAVARDRDTGRLVEFEILDRQAIEKRRAKSAMPNGEPWRNHFDRMAQKSAVRALCMRLPLAPSGGTLAETGVQAEEAPPDAPALDENPSPGEGASPEAPSSRPSRQEERQARQEQARSHAEEALRDVDQPDLLEDR